MSLLFLTAFSWLGLSSAQAGSSVYVNLGPYGAVAYPGAYGYQGYGAYPVNNGCCNGCGNNGYPATYYPTAPANYYPYYNQAPNNPYVFDNVNSPWASAAGRIVPTRMNPRNPYGY